MAKKKANPKVRLFECMATDLLAFHLLQFFSFGLFDVPHYKEHREE